MVQLCLSDRKSCEKSGIVGCNPVTVSGIVGCVSERKDEGHEQPVVSIQEGPSACDLRLWGDYHHPVGSYLPSAGDDEQGQVLGCTVLGACPPKALYVK